MDANKIIEGKYVLIVDDENDVLETLVDLLSDDCKIDTASTFEDAKKMIEENYYDIAILDIMGVNGYELLRLIREKNFPALMLTAHALTPENLERSADEGAAYFVPKEKMSKIKTYLADVIEAIEKKKSPWLKMYERFGSYYTKRFRGTNWREKENEFWKKRVKMYID